MKQKHLLVFCLLAILCFAMPTESNAAFELADGKVKIGAQARFRYEFFNNTDFS
mgnify:CR=1 FL=1